MDEREKMLFRRFCQSHKKLDPLSDEARTLFEKYRVPFLVFDSAFKTQSFMVDLNPSVQSAELIAFVKTLGSKGKVITTPIGPYAKLPSEKNITPAQHDELFQFHQRIMELVGDIAHRLESYQDQVIGEVVDSTYVAVSRALKGVFAQRTIQAVFKLLNEHRDEIQAPTRRPKWLAPGNGSEKRRRLSTAAENDLLMQIVEAFEACRRELPEAWLEKVTKRQLLATLAIVLFEFNFWPGLDNPLAYYERIKKRRILPQTKASNSAPGASAA